MTVTQGKHQHRSRGSMHGAVAVPSSDCNLQLATTRAQIQSEHIHIRIHIQLAARKFGTQKSYTNKLNLFLM